MKGPSETIQIRFDQEQAPWIRERIWHPSQKIKELPQGEILMEVKANPKEIKRWVLGYGIHAQVVKPIWLRDEIIKELEGQYLAYQKSKMGEK
jgi:predicted DNA-binding transcriptional regulator YafY